MVKLEELTIYKDKITEIINELLEPSNVEVLEFVRGHISSLSLNLNRSLIEFSIDNNTDAAEILLNLGADISTRDGRDKDYTPLHWAAYYNNPEMVTLLLDHGANIEETTNNDGSTALHLAAHRGNSQPMKILLKRGANVNAKDKSGSTPLHKAASEGHRTETQLLVTHGADVKAISDGQTPAECATNNGHRNIASWLMQNVTQEENNDIHDEKERKDKITQFLKRLLEPGKREVLEFLQDYIYYFMKDLNDSLAESSRDGKVILTEILLELGADIATRDFDEDYTPLHMAVYNENIEVIKCLLDRGANIEEKTSKEEETALHIAASLHNIKVMKLLLDRGANVNAMDKLNKTPLHVAADSGRRLQAVLLIKHGADIKAVSDGKTPEDYAKNNGHNLIAKWLNWQMETKCDKTKDITDEASSKNKIKKFLKELLKPSNMRVLEFLEDNIGDISTNINKALAKFAMKNKALESEVLLDLGADISTRDDDYTALHWAAYHGHTEVVQLLLDRGANIEEQSDASHTTALHIAASQGEMKVLKLLLDRGANVNARMEHNKTPLHEANGYDVAELLIKYGADIEAESDDGTPLHVAASEGKTEVVKLLLQRRANLNARNNMNRTPLHEAAGCGRHIEADLLVKFGADVEATSHVGTPADFARNNGHANLAEWLTQIAETNRDKNAEISHFTINNEDYKNKMKEVLEEILKPSNIEILEFFESYMRGCGNNVNKALQECVIQDSIAGAEIMLDLGANIATREDDRESVYTPLHWASYYGHTEMVKFLLHRGADIEETTSDSEGTALHVATYQGRREVLKLLLERGANVNAKDSSSKTPLHEAAKVGHRSEAQLLLKYGADIKAESEHGTPAQCAIEFGNDDIADWLNSL